VNIETNLETNLVPDPLAESRGPHSTAISHVVLIGNEHSRLGGVSGFMNTVAHGFLGRGYAVEIIGMTPTPGDAVVDFHRDPRIALHTMYHSQPPERDSFGLLDRLSPAKVARRLRLEALRQKALNRLRPIVASWGAETLVICTQIYAMEHLLAAGLQCGAPSAPYVIVQYHGSRQMAVTLKSITRLRRSYADADRFLALTRADAEQFRSFDQLNNTGFIPNPLPASSPGPASRHNEVISLNRYDEQKSLDMLLRAWAVLAPEFPDWRLRLYGEGPLRSELDRLIDELGVRGSASLEGITTDPGAVLRRSKIYAMTSQYEGLPLTIVEAARAGVPTVTFDCAPGIRELIEDGADGLVVAQNLVVALVAGLRRLMRDDSLRAQMGRLARERSERFALDTILDLWEDEMGTLTGRRATPSRGEAEVPARRLP
jgi:glycosyltransferase involved in cell wall biosynthesis